MPTKKKASKKRASKKKLLYLWTWPEWVASAVTIIPLCECAICRWMVAPSGPTSVMV